MTTAIITGASSGLGKEYAKQLSEMYKDIGSFWLIARRKERLEELAEELGKDKCLCLPLDLTSKTAFKELSDILADTRPEVKVLINNAGFGKLGNFIETDISQSLNQIKLNCEAVTGVTKAVLPYMSDSSQIINISSIASFVPNPRLSVYSASKSYVYAFSLALREELKPLGINVLAVCPGPMKTEFLETADIFAGSSKMFDNLPYVSTEKVVLKSLKRSAKKKSVSTNLLFYKFYHLLSKILPRRFLIKFTKV